MTLKKKFLYIAIGFIAFVILTNKPLYTDRERYECKGVIFDHYASKLDIYDIDGNLEKSSLWATIDGERKEVEPKVINPKAQLTVIYNPWGFWTFLKRSLTTGAFVIYEKTSDIYKYYRASSAHAFMFIKDKAGETRGNFDLAKDTIYVALPTDSSHLQAFSGTCERIY